MNRLLAATCLTPVALLAAAPAAAETVISTAVTTPVATGTANDDIRISSTGSIRPTVSGAAVTINSNHDARNEGTIAFAGVNDATGILANANVTADITNTGTITLDETFTPTDSDNDGDLDGPFAQGTGRFGIRVLGPGTFTGNIANSGTITIQGNQSAAISVESALAGALTVGGTINVITRILGHSILSVNDSWGVFSRSRINLLPHQLWVCKRVLERMDAFLGEADDKGGFTDTGGGEQHGVFTAFLQQDQGHLVQLAVTARDRVEAAEIVDGWRTVVQRSMTESMACSYSAWTSSSLCARSVTTPSVSRGTQSGKVVGAIMGRNPAAYAPAGQTLILGVMDEGQRP